MDTHESSTYEERVRELKAARKLHPTVESRLQGLLYQLYPDAAAVAEVAGVLGGRNDLIQFFFNGRRIVFELFFSASQVPQDLRLLEQSEADVKIAVLMDSHIDDSVSTQYFRKKPNAFPYFWLRQILQPKWEYYALARLRELIDEHSTIVRLRRILSSPRHGGVESSLKKVLDQIEQHIEIPPTSDAPDVKSLTGAQVASLRIISEVANLGIPVERLRSLYAWLCKAIVFGFELVVLGFQAFLITDLQGRHAIWSDCDLADDLIMGAYASNDAIVVMCINKILNDLFEANGFERQDVRFHFYHNYCELIKEVIPECDLPEVEISSDS